MILFYVLGAIICVVLGVVGFLFYILRKEFAGPGEVKVVPILNPQETFDTLKFAQKSGDFPVQQEQMKLAELAPQIEEYKKKNEELEEELRAISQKDVMQAQEAMKAMEGLSKENQVLKEIQMKQEEEHQKQAALTQEEMKQLQQDNASLQVNLQSSQSKVLELQELGVAFNQRMANEIKEAKTVMEQLKGERDAFLANRESSFQSVQNLTRAFEDIKAQNEALLQELEDARLTQQKLKELNDKLTEKNQLTQYELAKHRAQASGLERICENYKLQLAKKA